MIRCSAAPTPRSATDARSNHKCQGTGGCLLCRDSAGGRGGGGGGATSSWTAPSPDEWTKNESSLFDGIDTSLTALAQYAGPNPPADLTAGLAAIADAAKRAQAPSTPGNDAATAAPVEAGLAALRALRAQVPIAGLTDARGYEIDFRLKTKERDYEDAVLAAHGLTFDAVADDGLVIRRPAGEAVDGRGESRAIGSQRDRRRRSPASMTSGSLRNRHGEKGRASTPAPWTRTFPRTPRLTTPYFNDNYWKHPANHAINIFEPDVPFGVPFRPTPFRATFHVKAGSVEVTRNCPFSSAT